MTGNEPGLPSCLKVDSAAGGFEVTNESGQVVGGPFETNAAVWRSPTTWRVNMAEEISATGMTDGQGQ
jgi:hypothetical protein